MPAPVKMSRDAAPSSRARSLPPWGRRLLVTLYALTCFILGAAYIISSNRPPTHTVQLLTTPRGIAGQPLVISARIDLPAAGDATLRLALLDPKGRERAKVERALSASASRRAETELVMRLPNNLPPGENYSVRVDLEAEGSPIEEMTFPLEIIAISPSGDDGVRVGGVSPPLPDLPLLVELIPANGAFYDGVNNHALIRVTDPVTGAPIEDASLRVETTIGEVESSPKLPTSLRTDRFGLAAIDVLSRDEIDWAITARADGRETTRKLRVGVRVGLPQLDYASPVFVPRDATPLLITVHAPRPRPTYLNLEVDGSWIALKPFNITEERVSIQWDPDVELPAGPALATLSACFSRQGCRREHTHTEVLFAREAMTPSDALRAWIDLASPQLSTRASDYWRAVREGWETAPPSVQQVEHLTGLLRATLPRRFEPTRRVFDSDPEVRARMTASRDALRGQLNIITLLVLVTGALLIASWVTTHTLRRQRAMAAEIGDLDPTESPARAKVVFGVELLALVLTLTTFAWGIVVLLQRL